MFASVKYCCTGTVPQHVEKALADGAARKPSSISGLMTHLIAGENPDNTDIEETLDLYNKPVVTPKWVLHSVYCQKLLPVEVFKHDQHLFSKIVVCLQEAPAEDVMNLWAMVTYHGGEAELQLSERATHVIVKSTDDALFGIACKSNGKIKAVTPDWIAESVSSRKLLPEKAYSPTLLIVPPPKEPTPPMRPPSAKPEPPAVAEAEQKVSSMQISNPPESAAVEQKPVAQQPQVQQQPVQPQPQDKPLTPQQFQLQQIQFAVQQHLSLLARSPVSAEQKANITQRVQLCKDTNELQLWIISVRKILVEHEVLPPSILQDQRVLLQIPPQMTQPRQAAPPARPVVQQQQPRPQMQRLGLLQQQLQGQLPTPRQPGAQPRMLQNVVRQPIPPHGIIRPVQEQRQDGMQQQLPFQQGTGQAQPVNLSDAIHNRGGLVAKDGQTLRVVSQQGPVQQLQRPQAPPPQQLQSQQIQQLQTNQQQQQLQQVQQVQPGQQIQGQIQAAHMQLQQALANVQRAAAQQTPANQQQHITPQQALHMQQQQQLLRQQQPNQQQLQQPQPMQPQSVRQPQPRGQGAPQAAQRQPPPEGRARTAPVSQMRMPSNLPPHLQQVIRGQSPSSNQISRGVVQQQWRLQPPQAQQNWQQQSQQQSLPQQQHSAAPPQQPRQVAEPAPQQQQPGCAPQPAQQRQQTVLPPPSIEEQQAIQYYISRLSQEQLQQLNASVIARLDDTTRKQLQEMQHPAKSIFIQRILLQDPAFKAKMQLIIQQMQAAAQQKAAQGAVQETSQVDGKPQVAQPSGVIRQPAPGQPTGQLQTARIVQGQIILPPGTNLTEQQKQALIQQQLQLQQQAGTRVLVQGQPSQQFQGQGQAPQHVAGQQPSPVATPVNPPLAGQQGAAAQGLQQQIQQGQPPQQVLRQVITNQQGQVVRVAAPQQQQQNLQTLQQQQPVVPQQQKIVQQVHLPVSVQQNVAQQQAAVQQQVTAQQQALQQQLLQQQQLGVDPNGNPLVNPKTKTALATLLTSRLQTTAVVSPSPPLPQPPAIVQPTAPEPRATTPAQQPQPVKNNQPMTPQQQEQYMNQQLQKRQQAAQQLVNSATQAGIVKPAPPAAGATAPVVNTPAKATVAPTYTVARPNQFFGHEPTVKLPGELCLLGCVFVITDYHKTKPQEELASWRKVIAHYGGEVESTYGTRITHVLCCHLTNPFVQQAIRDNKRCVTAFWLSDVITRQQLLPPWTALHFPLPYSDDNRPCSKMSMTVSGFEGEERTKIKIMIDQLGAKYTGYFAKQTDILICKKADGEKYKKAREWRVAVVTVQWLNELLTGSQTALKQAHHPKYHNFSAASAAGDLFKIDYSQVQALMAAWKTPIRVTQEIYEKFKASPMKRQAPLKRKLSDPKPGESPMKKKKTESETTASSSLDAILDDVVKGIDCEPKKGPFVKFSGVTNAAELGRTVVKLEGNLASTPREATHLVMKSIQRTANFLSYISSVRYIVSPDWIVESERQNRFLDEEPFLLHDKSVEETFGFDLNALLAKSDRTSFLKDITFYLAHGLVPPGRQVMKDIIESAGGDVDSKRRSAKFIRQQLDERPGSYLVLCGPTDLSLVKDLLEADIGVYNPELVMTGVLRQKLDFESNKFTRHDLKDGE